jgi:hypothetical protein
MSTYTPYQERIRDCFAKAFRFLDQHKHARTDEDWVTISRAVGEYGDDPFMISLITAAALELEREYKASRMEVKK